MISPIKKGTRVRINLPEDVFFNGRLGKVTALNDRRKRATKMAGLWATVLCDEPCSAIKALEVDIHISKLEALI